VATQLAHSKPTIKGAPRLLLLLLLLHGPWPWACKGINMQVVLRHSQQHLRCCTSRGVCLLVVLRHSQQCLGRYTEGGVRRLVDGEVVGQGRL